MACKSHVDEGISSDQRVEQRSLPLFVIAVCFPFIRLCGDIVISVDTAGTAAPRSEQQHIETRQRNMMAAFFIHMAVLNRISRL